MKKKTLLFKIHSLEENRKELLLVLKNTQADLHDYISESKKQNNTITELKDKIYTLESFSKEATALIVEKQAEIKSLKERSNLQFGKFNL